MTRKIPHQGGSHSGNRMWPATSSLKRGFGFGIGFGCLAPGLWAIGLLAVSLAIPLFLLAGWTIAVAECGATPLSSSGRPPPQSGWLSSRWR